MGGIVLVNSGIAHVFPTWHPCRVPCGANVAFTSASVGVCVWILLRITYISRVARPAGGLQVDRDALYPWAYQRASLVPLGSAPS